MRLTVALGDHLAQAVEDVGKGRVLHIAHSGGALITYLAAQHHLSKRLFAWTFDLDFVYVCDLECKIHTGFYFWPKGRECVTGGATGNGLC